MFQYKCFFPATNKRVILHTNNYLNKRIAIQTLKNIAKYRKTSKEAITARIKQLDHEWDTERVLETNASIIIVGSSLLSLGKSKKWNYFTLLVGIFLLQHALQGWCPPLPLIRKCGVRTEEEINNEKVCLKFYRSKM